MSTDVPPIGHIRVLLYVANAIRNVWTEGRCRLPQPIENDRGVAL